MDCNRSNRNLMVRSPRIFFAVRLITVVGWRTVLTKLRRIKVSDSSRAVFSIVVFVTDSRLT